MNKKYLIIGVIFLLTTTLTGCLFPNEELGKNKIPNESQVKMVEEAVLQYMDETDGLIPIKTKEADIDAYDKDRKSTRLNSSHVAISYAVFCLKKKKNNQ